MSQNQLRIGVLGSGYIGRTYVEGMKFNSRCKLVAISGGTRAPGLAAEYHVGFEPSYDKMLGRSDIDAVLIASPPSFHVSQTIQAAEHGKHVLVEKPMATSIRDCDTMIRACEAAGVNLEVIMTLRFRGTPKRAKKLIADGEIGNVRMIRGSSLFSSYAATNPPAYSRDPKEGAEILDMGVHNFDIMRHFSGSDVKRVFGKVVNFGKEQPPYPTAMTQLEMKSGAICHQWMSFEMPTPNVPDSRHRYIVVGDKGILDIDGYGKLMLGRGDKWETVWTQPFFNPYTDPMNPGRLESYYTQVQAFIDDVLDNRPPMVPGSEGRAAVEIAQATILSSDTGKAVDLPLPA